MLFEAGFAGKRFSEGLLVLPLFPTCRDRSTVFSEIFGPDVRVLVIGAATRRPFGRQTRLGLPTKERDDSDTDKFKFGATCVVVFLKFL